MAAIPPGMRSFSYKAKTPGEQFISGTINAGDEAQAMQSLRELGLTEINLTLAATGAPLSTDDFFAFNQQLAQLAGAGLPVEYSLRLLAQEMRRGRLQSVIEQVAGDMERGKTMAQAIDARRGQFPPLYARIIDAGVRCGNLQAVLLNLGRHLSMVKRIQNLLWQTFTYPVLVLFMFMIAAGYVVVAVVPRLHGDIFTPRVYFGVPPPEM
ncbi:MAG TPA: type II secretion system F family protein, partial [Tepidisphaeraceae bacterium]|nr:type II secretion system F family protein [Tepidisphaeraceae bacterium]